MCQGHPIHSIPSLTHYYYHAAIIATINTAFRKHTNNRGHPKLSFKIQTVINYNTSLLMLLLFTVFFFCCFLSFFIPVLLHLSIYYILSYYSWLCFFFIFLFQPLFLLSCCDCVYRRSYQRIGALICMYCIISSNPSMTDTSIIYWVLLKTDVGRWSPRPLQKRGNNTLTFMFITIIGKYTHLSCIIVQWMKSPLVSHIVSSLFIFIHVALHPLLKQHKPLNGYFLLAL